MSNRIFMDDESYEILREWSEQNLNYVLTEDFFFKHCEMIFKEVDVKAYVDVKKNKEIRINIKQHNTQIIKSFLERTPDGPNHYNLGYNICNENLTNEAASHTVQVVATAYLMANAYLFFGNKLENREVKAVGRNDGEDKVIVFRKHRDKFYYIPVKAHKSPEGVFSVRGHIRHYKNGKDIWIDEYLKGVDRENE